MVKNDEFHGNAETPLFCTKSHWLVFLPWMAASVALCIGTIISLRLSAVFSLLLFICFCGCFFETVCRLILFLTAEYAIYANGLYYEKASMLGKIADNIDLSRFMSVSIESFEPKLDCGTVIINTIDGKRFKLRDIKHPLKFKETIERLLYY